MSEEIRPDPAVKIGRFGEAEADESILKSRLALGERFFLKLVHPCGRETLVSLS
jgi:hypothetical protein